MTGRREVLPGPGREGIDYDVSRFGAGSVRRRRGLWESARRDPVGFLRHVGSSLRRIFHRHRWGLAPWAAGGSNRVAFVCHCGKMKNVGRRV